jgi:hypothetical protein
MRNDFFEFIVLICHSAAKLARNTSVTR